jgi:hypothetical protein
MSGVDHPGYYVDTRDAVRSHAGTRGGAGHLSGAPKCSRKSRAIRSPGSRLPRPRGLHGRRAGHRLREPRRRDKRSRPVPPEERHATLRHEVQPMSSLRTSPRFRSPRPVSLRRAEVRHEHGPTVRCWATPRSSVGRRATAPSTW